MNNPTPLDLLLPYQRTFVLDRSRFKIWLAARQIGKSFTAAMEVAMDCLERPGTMWVILSAGERQALEMMEKVKQCLQAWELTLEWDGVERNAAGEFKSAECILKNRSRVIALPANPSTARGYSANIVLDEFAFHGDPEAIWRAIYPTISNPLKGELKCRIMSTPNGQGGQGSKFYQIWSGSNDEWSRHKTTIHDAKAGGLPINVEQLRKAAGDLDGWRQEYECEFIDTSRVAFSYDLIAGCEDPAATLIPQAPFTGQLYLGVDIGTVNDPTVCYSLERRGALYTAEVFSAQGVALSDQDDFIAPRIERAARVSMDASGVGRDIAQRMVRRYGGKVIAQVVNSTWKRKAFQALIAGMSDRRVLLPPDKSLRDDMHAYEVSGAGETATYRAPRTDEGHSDRTSALVHAYDAAHQEGGFFVPLAFERTQTPHRRPRSKRSLGTL